VKKRASRRPASAIVASSLNPNEIRRWPSPDAPNAAPGIAITPASRTSRAASCRDGSGWR